MILNDLAIAEQISLHLNCGYWELNGQYFFDKSECLRHASRIKSDNVRYHFFDSVYMNMDWSKEPNESIEELYKRRAQQLRDKYDYLILCFSGGSDSSNILNSFIDNNIKLDEVYCEYPIDIMNKNMNVDMSMRDPTLLTYEWYTAAKPRLDALSVSHPNIKITVDDVASDAIKIVDDCNVYKLFRGGVSVNPNAMKYYRLYEIARDREKYGKVACITGLDKPRIGYKRSTNTFFSMYSDFTNIFCSFPDETFSKYQAVMEHFYYAVDMPELNQKQCFLVKNAILELFNNKQLLFYKDLLLNDILDETHSFDIHHDFFKKILYKKWNTNIWQAEKSPNFFYTPSNQWFFDSNVTAERTRDYFDKQLLELLYGIDDKFIIYENKKPSALKNIMSTPIRF